MIGLVFLYLAAIIIANLTTAYFGAWFSVVNAFLFIGLDITTRDSLHEKWRGKWLYLKLGLLIGTGSLLSWLLNANAGQIALASFISFAIAGVIDTIVYAILGAKAKWIKVNGSNVASSLADSILFPTIAFGSFIPLVTLLQFACKVFGGSVWYFVLNRRKA